MTDALYLATVLVAFAAFVGLIRLCDRVVGADEPGAAVVSPPATEGADR